MNAGAVPAVSVIVPVFNTAPYLASAIGSLQSQTLTSIEIVCVDDASTDESVSVLKKIAEVDSRIRLIQLETNVGQGSARNVGISDAVGRYIYCFDSDDELASEALEKLVARADSDRLDVLYFNAEPRYETQELEEQFGGYRDYYHRAQRVEGTVTGQELFAALANANEWLPSVCTQLINREWLLASGLEFPNYVFHEDQYFSVAVALSARNVGLDSSVYFRRRVRADSTVTKKPTARHVSGLVEAVGRITSLADSLEITPESLTGQALHRELQKTFTDAVTKFAALDESQVRLVLGRDRETFSILQVHERLAIQLAANREHAAASAAQGRLAELDAGLAAANERIREYQQTLWRRLARKLFRRGA